MKRRFIAQYHGPEMNKTLSALLEIDAQNLGCGKLENLLHLQAACPWKGCEGWGTGAFSINSNRNLYTATRASQYNVHVYLHIHISGVLACAHGQDAGRGGVG